MEGHEVITAIQSTVSVTTRPHAHPALSWGAFIFNIDLPTAAKIYLSYVPWQSKVRRDLGREAIIELYNREIHLFLLSLL